MLCQWNETKRSVHSFSYNYSLKWFLSFAHRLSDDGVWTFGRLRNVRHIVQAAIQRSHIPLRHFSFHAKIANRFDGRHSIFWVCEIAVWCEITHAHSVHVCFWRDFFYGFLLTFCAWDSRPQFCHWTWPNWCWHSHTWIWSFCYQIHGDRRACSILNLLQLNCVQCTRWFLPHASSSLSFVS